MWAHSRHRSWTHTNLRARRRAGRPPAARTCGLDGGPLGAVIAGFLEAVERGEKPDRAAILAAHPQLAAELAAYFADLDRIDRLAAPLRLADPGQTAAFDTASFLPPTVRYFGDYGLLEEIARGAWGSCTGPGRRPSTEPSP